MEKQDDEIFCPECGKPVKRNAVICVNCGIQIKEIKTSPVKENADNPPAKSKGVAIVLAIFLGFWSWLYTYKKDFKKFWIYAGISIVLFIGVIIAVISEDLLISVTTQQPTGSPSFLAKYGTWIWVLILSGHVWAFCNSVIRPENFYKNYPNG